MLNTINKLDKVKAIGYSYTVLIAAYLLDFFGRIGKQEIFIKVTYEQKQFFLLQDTTYILLTFFCWQYGEKKSFFKSLMGLYLGTAIGNFIDDLIENTEVVSFTEIGVFIAAVIIIVSKLNSNGRK